jgi:hypothetical protein
VRFSASRPTPNLEDQGIPLRLAPTLDLSDLGGPTSSYATACIALRVSGALTPLHHDKVGIASVGKHSKQLPKLKMSSWTWYRVALAWTDVSEILSFPSSGFLTFDTFPQPYYRSNTVTESPHRRTPLILKLHCLLGCFHSGVNLRCLLGRCTVEHWLEPTFRRTYHLHLQGSLNLIGLHSCHRGNAVT